MPKQTLLPMLTKAIKIIFLRLNLCGRIKKDYLCKEIKGSYIEL